MDDTLALLERIGASHRRMTALAEALDWDALVTEWHGIHPEVVALRELPLDRLGDRERARAASLIAELIEFEKRIAARITPWMEQVRPLLETFRQYPLHGKDA
jgi:sugar phosphate isomerase/epimerase